MKITTMPKPPIWKTIGAAFTVCIIGLFVCVYLLFGKFQSYDKQLQRTEQQLQKTEIELQLTREQRNYLKRKIEVLESIEHQRGTALPPIPPPMFNR